MKTESIRSMGWDAAANGQGADCNPHGKGTAERAAWLAGWESYHFGR